MRLSEIQQSFSRDIVRLLLYIEQKECKYTFGETYRTVEQAEIYVKQGKGIINSLHCKRLAADINIFSKEGKLLTEKNDYQPFGKFWESLHPANRWGGCFDRVDADHFERNEKVSI